VGITCPLTTWEQDFRLKSGQQTYQGDFIANWVHDVLFFEAPPWMLITKKVNCGAVGTILCVTRRPALSRIIGN
jgi:hypothetical protein